MSQQLLDAYESLLQSLWDRMAQMLGRFTTYTLMERSLFITGSKYPLLNDLVLSETSLDFSQINDKADLLDDGEVKEAFNSFVVNLVTILAEQVGKAMANQIAGRTVLPDE